jgi:leucyl aminopeptidase
MAVVKKPEIERLISNASADRLWAFLTELSSMPDRSATTDNGKKAAEFLKARATEIAGSLPGFRADLVSTGSMYGQPSVVVTIPGTDSSLPGVVLGGHMDTFSNTKPGADDDGSGSASVMEALTAVAKSWVSFKNTIHFVWYAAEERGLVGSSYVVKKFQADKIPVKAVMQLDMVGYDSEDDAENMFVITDNTDAALNTQLKQLITTYTDAKIGETRCGYACSDHANWHRAGIPAVFPFETSFDNMNHRLHTGDDKISYLSKDHSFRFVQVALAFLGENAQLNTLSVR